MNMGITNQRIIYLDTLRGFAILLVIVGHLIQYNYKSSIQNEIFNIIYSFHMPLFFFLSGCTCSLQGKKKGEIQSWEELFVFYIKKCRSLLLPSITWTLLVPLFFSQTGWIWNGSISSFWFLNVLFAISSLWNTVLFIDSKLGTRNIFLWITLAVIIILFAFDIKRVVLMYLILYIFGYFFQQNSWLQKCPYYAYEIALFLFLLGVGHFSYGSTEYGNGNRVWLEMPLSIMASMFLTKLFSCLKNRHLIAIFTLLGQYSLGIYLAHFLFVEIPYVSSLEYSLNYITQFITLFIPAILIAVCCVVIEKTVGQFPFLHKLLYGKQ